MAYKRQHVKKRFRPKPGKLLDQVREVMTKLLYGTGLRLMECIRLRVKDVDFENHQIIVRDSKGGKDRATVLPKTLQEDLRFHLNGVQKLFEQELAEGLTDVYIPHALTKKYPAAGKSWI